MSCANVRSNPWYRRGCTDDSPCRLGDADSMTFLPWVVPRTEPPVQLHEIGPDRGHLLSEGRSDVTLYVDVEPGMRTAAAIGWETTAKISLLVLLALSLLTRGCCSSVYCSSTGCCSSTCCCCCCCGRCSCTRWWSTRSHPTESFVDQNCLRVSSGCWLLSVSQGPKAAVPRNPAREKNQRKNSEKQHIT